MPSEHRTGQGRRGGARRAPDFSFIECREMCKSAPPCAPCGRFSAAPRRLTATFGGRSPATWSVATMCDRWPKTTRWLLKRLGAAGPRGVRRGHRSTGPPGRGLLPLAARQAGRRGGSGGGRARAGTAAGPDERSGRIRTGSEPDRCSLKAGEGSAYSPCPEFLAPDPARPAAGRATDRARTGGSRPGMERIPGPFVDLRSTERARDESVPQIAQPSG